MDKIIVFTESILPSTCHFIPAQVNQLLNFAPTYAGLVPAQKNLELDRVPILLEAIVPLPLRWRASFIAGLGQEPNFMLLCKE